MVQKLLAAYKIIQLSQNHKQSDLIYVKTGAEAGTAATAACAGHRRLRWALLAALGAAGYWPPPAAGR